ncbi:MAG: hypothetical protein V1779_05500 [bacterium]
MPGNSSRQIGNREKGKGRRENAECRIQKDGRRKDYRTIELKK